MAKLRGRGVGAGMALGTAAIVRVTSGIPLLPEPPERIADLIATRRLRETPEVILVAEDYKTALAIAPSLSWAKVVGITTGSAEADAPVVSIPVVVDVPGLMSAVQDDMLMLVDATRGSVLADPDPVYLAQYTAEHERIAPKHRLYLDDSHQPAQTIDGRSIQIVALAEESVEPAVESGADAIYISLPLEFDPDIQRRNLTDLVDRAAGKPILLTYNSFLPLNSLVQAASCVDITLVIPPNQEENADVETATQMIVDLEQAIARCMEKDLVCAMPLVAVEFLYPASTPWLESVEKITTLVEELAEKGITRLIGLGVAADLGAYERLDRLAAITANHFIPLTCYLDTGNPQNGTLEALTPLLIGAGVTGLMAEVKEIQTLKERVRELSYEECREKLRERLMSEERA